ncbi:FGGY family carbohydrate kinase [Phycicoccus sp. Soil803]|uniref:FGGY family carbohydrate kinase n=1 Tax=Phycicoccus sp. Soil803 TaxID=1736415 RepID=UPI000709BCE9|nr:FGGY family carbohydrate kinase [Phycicoccus sp. Soil803]KRF23196.1 xylulose kinase [Phycicoccus sp. Soil803]
MPDAPRTLVAGVDSSTQSTKVVVCDAATGEIVRSGRAPHPDGTSVHPDRWWDAFTTATADGLLDDVAGIAVGGQQHGMCALDESGAVVREALLWNDTRSAQSARDLTDELGGPQEWVRRTGSALVPSFTVTKVRWLAEHEPDNAARVHDVVLPHDWLTAQILKQGNGFERYTTDRGDASGTGYFSSTDNSYLPELQELALGRVFGVPTVLGPHEVAGRTDLGMVVGPGTGDNAGAVLGLGLRPGDVVVSLGTSGAVFADADRPVADPNGLIASFASASGGHLPLMATLNAARVLTAAAQLLGTDLAGLDRLALAAAPGAGGLTLLPYLDGERSPNLPDATGTLGGLTRANATPENLARAAVEGMLANLVAGVADVRRLGLPVERVVLIGGAAASAAVRAVAPGLFGVPVAIPEPGEYVGLGAARQAAWVLGGDDHPPEWEVRYEATLDPPVTGEGTAVLDRYATLLASLHPS